MISFNNTIINLTNDGSRRLTATFQLESGDFALLFGLNGAGKTTLLDTIAGIRQVTSGIVKVTPTNCPIAYAVQDSASSLLPWKTIQKNILFPSTLADIDDTEIKRRMKTLLEEFRLAERCEDYPYRLSEGEKQIVNLIRCVCTPSKVVLLDEPFAALNSHAKVKAKRIITEFAKDCTTVLVTHDLLDCDLPLNRFFFISDSNIIEVNKPTVKKFLQADV